MKLFIWPEYMEKKYILTFRNYRKYSCHVPRQAYEWTVDYNNMVRLLGILPLKSMCGASGYQCFS